MNAAELQRTRKAETQRAANLDHLNTDGVAARTSGWNAYEVWFRMVKQARDQRRTKV